MTMRWFLIGLLALSGSALAVRPAIPPGILPTEVVRPLLEQDPGVAAARAGLDAARQAANILDNSPHEWTARATGQQRRLDGGPSYNEWNVGIERTIRLPAKAQADRNLGAATVEESQARHSEAMHEAARELLSLWVDWLAAERARELAQGNLQAAQSSLMAVQTRQRAGDASRLDLSIARAEHSEQRRLDIDARTQAEAAWLRLSARYPGMKRQLSALPEPVPIGEDAAFFAGRILAESHELKTAQAKVRIAQAHADRSRAERIPDPTVGVYSASEVGGKERLSGIMLSIPIPGGNRDSRETKAVAEVEVSRQEFELRKRQIETQVAGAVATARGAHEILQAAIEGATEMRESADLMQRAYALGEADLQALLLARRQAAAASSSALLAQVAAVKAHGMLLVDAHLIWNLEATSGL